MHSSLGFPSTRATANAEVKVSPAPVVSITSVAGIIGCLIGSSPSTNKADPCDPSLTSTSLTPCTRKRLRDVLIFLKHSRVLQVDIIPVKTYDHDGMLKEKKKGAPMES
jgi:hypothetical protein